MKLHNKNNKIKFKYLAAALMLAPGFSALADTIDVYNAEELQNALKSANPGDEIILNQGNYFGEKWKSGNSKSHFFSDRSGTANNPIIVRSLSPLNKQVLMGDDVNSGYILYLQGDHWQIKDLKFSTAQKGIMLEGANNNVIDNVAVSNVGAEAVHFRYFSSNNTLKNCYIHNTGKRDGKEGFGEAVYVGTHNGHTSSKLDNSNNNRIGGCSIGPNITAEAFDVKSGTSGTIIESNYISGKGIIGAAGSPAADSFIDLKGTDVIVRNNVMDWENDNNIAHAIFTYQEHRSSNIYDNQIRMSTSAPTYKALEETIHARNNVRLDNGTKLVEKDYQLSHVDDQLDQSFEKPAASYTCFDELTNGCGTAPSEPVDPPQDPVDPPQDPVDPPQDPVDPPQDPVDPPQDPVDPPTDPVDPPASNSCNGTANVAWDSRTEINVAETNCITFTEDLSNERLQAWDSDANNSCDFRGEIVSVTNSSVQATVTANYHSFSQLSGNTFRLEPNNNCQYIKVRAY